MKNKTYVLLVYWSLCILCVGSVRVKVFNYVNYNGSINVAMTSLYENEVVVFSSIDFMQSSSYEKLFIRYDNEHRCWNVSVSFDNETESYPLPELSLTSSSNLHLIVYGDYGNKNSLKTWVKIQETEQIGTSLGIDQTLLTVTNNKTRPVVLTGQSSYCYKCSNLTLHIIYPGETYYVIVDTKFGVNYYFTDNVTQSVIYSIHHHFREHSKCSLSFYGTTSYYHIDDNGQNANLPILYAAIILIGAFVIWSVGTYLYSWLRKKGLLHLRRVDRAISQDLGDPETVNNYGAVNSVEESPLVSDVRPTSAKVNEATDNPSDGNVAEEETVNRKPKRLKSLDTIRGLSLMIMIFVNYGGGGYWFFNHSPWNGITVADLVFPWFVWIMGVSIVYSFRGRKQDSFFSRFYQVIRRSVILMALGLFLNQGYTLSKWRIPGVLQRFAIAYFVVALTELLTTPLYNKFRIRWRITFIRDLTSNWIQWILTLALEMVWFCITFYLDVPGCPRGYLGPGGLSDNSSHINCVGGAAGYIDKKILTVSHIYGHPTCKVLYNCNSYDPEGILGSINTIVICFLGVQAGRIIIYHKSHRSRIIRFVIWGLVLGLLGTALCEGSVNDGVIPLNKNLWSLSFILVTAGMGYLLLTLFYILIDLVQIWNGAPFIYPGMNSILVYVGSELLEGMFPFGWDGMRSSHMDFLASNIISVSLWTLIAYYWYVIKFFVKI